MLSKAVLTLVATTGLLVAAVALAPTTQIPRGNPTGSTIQSQHNPRQMTGKLLGSCLEEPVGCGLVVW